MSYLSESLNTTVAGVSFTTTNYKQAVELLLDRYGNSQALISALLKKFVLLPKIEGNDDIRGLCVLCDQLESGQDVSYSQKSRDKLRFPNLTNCRNFQFMSPKYIESTKT